MKTAVLPIVLLVLLGFMVISPLSHAGGGVQGAYYGPPLDETLMAFVDQGVWYYLCRPRFTRAGLRPAILPMGRLHLRVVLFRVRLRLRLHLAKCVRK